MQRLRFFVLTLVIALVMPAAAGAVSSTTRATFVQIKDFAFKPGTVEVKRGDSVSFGNASGVPHTATSGSFDTKRIAPRQIATVRFGKRGTFAYHCKIHPFMKGKVVVE